MHKIPTDVPVEDQIEPLNQAEQEQGSNGDRDQEIRIAPGNRVKQGQGNNDNHGPMIVHNNTSQILPTQATNRPHTPRALPGENSSNQILQPNQNASGRQNASSDQTENTENLNQTPQDGEEFLTIKFPKEVSIRVSITGGSSEPKIWKSQTHACPTCSYNLNSLLFFKTITQNNAPKNVERSFVPDTISNRNISVVATQLEKEPSSSQSSRILPNTTPVTSEPHVSTSNAIEPTSRSISPPKSLDGLTQGSGSVDARLQPEESANANHPTTGNETQPLPSLSSTAESVHLSQEPSLPEQSTRPE